MYSDWAFPVALGFLAGWLLVLSFLVWRQSNFLRLLFPKSGERDIRRKFKELTEAIDGFKTQLNRLEGSVTEVQGQGRKHIQKVGLSRFNPYDDTGGDQSFSVALLDDLGSGIVVTSLHARSGTRVFGKEILSGESGKYQLSKEEELVIEKAMAK